VDRTPNFAASIMFYFIYHLLNLKPVPYCVSWGVSEVQVFAPLVVHDVVDVDVDEDYHGVYCHSDSVGVNYAGRKVGGRLYLDGTLYHVRD